jgi:transposase
MDTIIQPVISPSKRGAYRRHTSEFKRAVVEQSLRIGASVSRVAREHNVNANQVFAWRKLFNEGQLGDAAAAGCTLLPVALAMTPAPAVPLPDEPCKASASLIHLTIGKAELRLEGQVDMVALALVLERLLA